MDASDCSFLTFATTHEGSFYFQVDDEGFESDAFEKSRQSQRYIKNKSNQFLVLSNGDQLLFDMDNTDSTQFTLQMYNWPGVGMAVTLFTCKGNKKQVVCCNPDTGDIYAETLNALPDNIADSGDKALFFLHRVNGTYHKVESSLQKFRSRYLGFEADAQTSLHRLVLRPSWKDNEPDEPCHMQLCKKKV